MDEREPMIQPSDSADLPRQPYGETSKLVVDFNPHGDPENPMEWRKIYKWSIVALLALTAFTVTFTCISVVPIATQIIIDLEGQRSRSASVLLVTIWELGEAAGPLLIGPMSEIFGRYPVINTANMLFITATVMAALSPSATLLIAARFLTGLAVAANVLNPAIVGDLFVSEQRGTAIGMVMLTPVIGGAIGPTVSGAIAEQMGWRAILWISAGLAGACELVFLTCFRETYKPVILARRAKKLRKDTGNAALKTVFEVNTASKPASIWENIMRPMIVLYSSSVLQLVTVFGGVGYAYFYVMSTTLPDILSEVYGWTPALCGSAFVGFSVGSLVANGICNAVLDRLYVRLGRANKGLALPEHRLPLSIAGAFLFPPVIALYGWIPQAHLPVPLEITMTGMWGFCLILTELPMAAYVVDAFGRYSASAMTAMIVMRCLMGTFLPMAAAPLIDNFGYGWGMTVFAAVTLAIAPTTVLVMRYGASWRKRSSYSQDE